MKKFNSVIFVTLTAFIIAFTAPASAAVIIDQNFTTTDDPNNGTGVGIVTTSLAQTFEVGLTGSLAAIELNILKFSGTTADLTIDIRSLVGSSPDPLAANALATVNINNSAIATLSSSPHLWSSIYVDFSFANIAVTAGDSLSFVISSVIGEGFDIQTDYLNGYSNGSRWSQNGDGATFSELSTADLAFNSYIDVANIPEPSIWALFSIGMVGLGLARRRKF